MNLPVSIIGVTIFAATYVLISARRLGYLPIDRPSAALLGAIACVAMGVLSPGEALAAIDDSTILLLFGMMGMGAFLGATGFFTRAAQALSLKARSPARLLALIVWGAGGLAALITNDAVCVLGAPLVVELIRKHRLPALPFLLALATAANTGSAATLVGNPQNMLCASLGDLSYRAHLLLVGPAAVAGLAINHGLLRLMFRRQLAAATLAREEAMSAHVLTTPSLTILAVLTGTVIAYTLGANLAWTAAGGFALLFLLRREQHAADIWSRIDWSVLVFFAGLFVVVEGLVRSGAPAWFFAHAPLASLTGFRGWLGQAGVFLVGSNIVSNVPFILVVRDQMATLADPRLSWELLTMASTFAGNLTLIGSVANIIVAEKSREVGGIGFWAYLRVGLPLSLLTTLVGALWIYAVG